jgi:hypothetical protein
MDAFVRFKNLAQIKKQSRERRWIESRPQEPLPCQQINPQAQEFHRDGGISGYGSSSLCPLGFFFTG